MSIKHQLRGTAVGIFIATSTFAATFYMGNNDVEITEEQAINYLEEDQFIVLSLDEYNDIQTELSELKEELQNTLVTDQKAEKKKEETEQSTGEKEEEQQEAEVVEDSVIESVLVVSEGMTTRDIAEQLERLKIVENAREFERHILELGIDRRLRMGEYTLTNNMSRDEVISVIAAPN